MARADRVITNAGTVLRIASDNAATPSSLGTKAQQYVSFLRSYEPEWNRVLARAPGRIEALEALIRDAEEVLPGFLDAGVSFTDVVMSYEPHMRALLQEYARGLGSVLAMLRGGEQRIELISVRTARCDYGTTRHEPFDPERYAFQKDGACAASFGLLQRGAAHAPGPIG